MRDDSTSPMNVTSSHRQALKRPSSSCAVQPRSLEWLLRFIDEIYNARFSTFLSEISSPDGTIETFSSFVFNHISKKFGLDSLVKSTSRQLLDTVKRYKNENKNVELFALFLSPYYSVTDLMFFLYARSKALLVSQHTQTQKCHHFKKVKLGADPHFIPAAKVSSLTKQILAAQPTTLRQCCFNDYRAILQLPSSRHASNNLSRTSSGSSRISTKSRKLTKIDLYEYLIILLVHYKALREAKDDKDRPYYFTILPEDIPSYDRVRLRSVNQFTVLREKVHDENIPSLPHQNDSQQSWSELNHMRLHQELDRESIDTDEELRTSFSEYMSPSRSPLNVQRQILKHAQQKEKNRHHEQQRFMDYIQRTKEIIGSVDREHFGVDGKHSIFEPEHSANNDSNSYEEEHNFDNDDTTPDEHHQSFSSSLSSSLQHHVRQTQQRAPVQHEPLSAEELYLKEQNELLRRKLKELQHATDYSLDSTNEDDDESMLAKRHEIARRTEHDASTRIMTPPPPHAEGDVHEAGINHQHQPNTNAPQDSVLDTKMQQQTTDGHLSKQDLSTLLSPAPSLPNHFVTGDLSREMDADPTHLFDDRESSASPPATHARELTEDIRRVRRQITRQLLEEIADDEDEEGYERSGENGDEEEGEIIEYEYYEYETETDDDEDAGDVQPEGEHTEGEQYEDDDDDDFAIEKHERRSARGYSTDNITRLSHDNGHDLDEFEDNESRTNFFSHYS